MTVHKINKFIPTKPERSNPEAKLREVSELYEKQFLREMMKSMRSTIQEGGFIKSNQAEKIFREQLDNEYVEQWGSKGGIGLADMIHKQLTEKYGVQLGMKAPLQKINGPIKLDERSNLNVVPQKNSNKDQSRLDLKIEIDSLAENSKPGQVVSPWEGKLLSSYQLGSDDNLITLEHDNGLRSKLLFKGTKLNFEPGQNIQAGQTLGVLSPDSKSMLLSLQGLDGTKVENEGIDN